MTDYNDWPEEEEVFTDEDQREAREALYDFFIRHIHSEDPQTRGRAVQAVHGLECDPRLSETLRQLINDTDPDKNALAIRCIGIWKHTDGSDLLINFMTQTANQSKLTESVVESVLIALGEIGDAAAFEFLSHYALETFNREPDMVSSTGMACNESIMMIARKGNEGALQYLIQGCNHPAWNMRESCAACFGALYAGKNSLPKIVHDTLMELTRDENKNVRIAAYISLDEIIGLSEENRQILRDARKRQIFGDSPPNDHSQSME